MRIQLVFRISQQQRLCGTPGPAILCARACGLAFFLLFTPAFARNVAKKEDLWSLKPIVRPEVPRGVTSSPNPIDAFIAEACRDKSLSPVGTADRLTWLRRVSLDLIGLPPSIEE